MRGIHTRSTVAAGAPTVQGPHREILTFSPMDVPPPEIPSGYENLTLKYCNHCKLGLGYGEGEQVIFYIWWEPDEVSG